MQDLQQRCSKEQQSSKSKGIFSLFLKQAEFSKRMAIFDTIYYIAFVIICIISSIIWPDFAVICPELITILTTGLVTLRLGYTAKAGFENWKKISSDISEVKNNFLQNENNSEEESG